MLQTIVESSSSETLKFYWKVSSQQNSDYLEFYIDGTLQSGRISGEVDWTLKTYTISSGIHTLKWCYVKDYSGSSGDDCGWVDFVQWTGYSPVPDSDNWQQLDYKYDVGGRRSEKIIDGYGTRYVYDGPHVIAEYDGNNNLLRKYIYGPGIDQPVSMIEVADNNAAYYYHYDALGSVIALSDSTGDTVQTYEYSVFGEPAVEDANHTNPYMFAGRRYDIEIGLYYNRARYYNPYTGRFLQTDPSGYSDGMNWYAYCGSNPLNCTDPTGLYADNNDSNGANEYNPYGTDCYKFIKILTAMANYYNNMETPGLGGDYAIANRRGQFGDELVDALVPADFPEVHHLLGGDGESNFNYPFPAGTSGFRNALIAGDQGAQVYQHVGAAASAAIKGVEYLIDLFNWQELGVLEQDQGNLIENWENEELRQRYQAVVLGDLAELYGNEAGRLVGRALGGFIDGDINSETLERELIGILGDDQLRNYFGIRQTRLYLPTRLSVLY